MAVIAEKKRRGRWYWHCHACGQYVPRDESHCPCGATKQQRRKRAGDARKPPQGNWSLVFGVGVVLLWLALLWMVLREHTPPPTRRRGAVDAPAPAMTQRALDSAARSADTSS